jgi:hypothetical protein
MWEIGLPADAPVERRLQYSATALKYPLGLTLEDIGHIADICEEAAAEISRLRTVVGSAASSRAAAGS